MADNSIVQGLFGVDPAAYQQQQAAAQNSQALQFAEMSGAQQGQYGAFRGGQMLGNVGANLLGAQDPILQKATIAKQLAGQFDTNTIDGLKGYADALMKNGAPDLAQMALQRANDLSKAGLENIKTQSEISKNMGANQTEVMKTQQAIAALRAQGDPQGQIPALEDRLRSLVKSDIPASVYNSVIAPQTEKSNVANQNKAELDRLAGQIDNGILKFGVTDNFRNKLKTISGESTEGSRAAQDFNSTLESIRLPAQIQQKGSQSDRDAANIMNSY